MLSLVTAIACTKSGSKALPTATVPTAPAVTPTTDPYAIPPVIDEAYVNRVLGGFDAIRGDVYRLAMRERTIPPESIDRYRSIYGNGDYLQVYVDLLQDDLRKGFSDYRDPPGNLKTTVQKLITVKASCIFAEVQSDSAEVASPPVPPPAPEWVVLAPKPDDIDPYGYNSTPWYLAYHGFKAGRVAPPDPCAKL